MGYCLVTVSCEHRNERSGSVREMKFVDELSNC
jgi:hypothetical protein